MGLEQAIVRTSLSMIRQFGVEGYFQRATGISYKPGSGDVSVAEETHSAKMLVGPIDRKVLNPTESDTQITLSASGLRFDPQLGDRVYVHGRNYTVNQVRKVYAIGLLALYVLGVKS